MHPDTLPLAISALTLGFVHTILGPDHYIPFVALARARGWSLHRTVWVTLICGVGHVGSSVLLGLVGIAFGVLLARLTAIESFRGDLAAWLLIAFGLTYFAWGLRRATRPHSHHHLAPTDGETTSTNVTPWVLFLIFVFGPCEPLIPLLMYPASQLSSFTVLVTILAFSLATLATMTTAVILLHVGSLQIVSHSWHRFAHALAGLTILACGCLVKLGIA
jgi:sulfite exporter TauE/SafE